ncbi:MAG: hypothetical protein UY92_C0002G0070 [Candidatus Magasanikbacteria bacterium GW2011_GWA2_56_11]|uniref:Lipoprotein n=1 Tax=Candidatus Magasanikbacteria bacterium GW2011_GWA2_56_11 TaxID=1619044 RepID=A0A0G1YHP8_9BACT|nr:MAG: hypothetical protein UY92_C0002G0070 [Candidatus Magasanikbacteria bacterium GW2011_GWA2_56_11]
MRGTFVTLSGCLLLFGAGCGPIYQSESSPMTVTQASPASGKNVLELILQPQDAQFYVAAGWTGGMGSAPVVDPATGAPVLFAGAPIYFDESYAKEIEAKLPACYAGEPQIIVTANITLTKRTDINPSIPGAPEETYYEAVVNSLKDISVAAEPCS